MPDIRHLPRVTTHRRVWHRSPNTLPSIRGLAPRLQTPNARCSLPVPVLWYSPHHPFNCHSIQSINQAQLQTKLQLRSTKQNTFGRPIAPARKFVEVCRSCCPAVVTWWHWPPTVHNKSFLNFLHQIGRELQAAPFPSHWATHSPNRWAMTFPLWGKLEQLFHRS